MLRQHRISSSRPRWLRQVDGAGVERLPHDHALHAVALQGGQDADVLQRRDAAACDHLQPAPAGQGGRRSGIDPGQDAVAGNVGVNDAGRPAPPCAAPRSAHRGPTSRASRGLPPGRRASMPATTRSPRTAPPPRPRYPAAGPRPCRARRGSRQRQGRGHVGQRAHPAAEWIGRGGGTDLGQPPQVEGQLPCLHRLMVADVARSEDVETLHATSLRWVHLTRPRTRHPG